MAPALANYVNSISLGGPVAIDYHLSELGICQPLPLWQ